MHAMFRVQNVPLIELFPCTKDSNFDSSEKSVPLMGVPLMEILLYIDNTLRLAMEKNKQTNINPTHNRITNLASENYAYLFQFA